MKLFLEAGAGPNIRNNEGKTPLDLAVEFGLPEAVEILKQGQGPGHIN